MPFDVGINQGAGNWDTKSPPLCDEQHQIQTEDIGREFIHPRLVSERHLLAGFFLGRLVADQIDDSIGGWRQGCEDGERHFINQRGGVPITGFDHPQDGPVAQRSRHQACQIFERRRALRQEQRNQQPAPNAIVLPLRALEIG